MPRVRVSADRDQPDRIIVITGIGRSWSPRSASWSRRSGIVITCRVGHPPAGGWSPR